MQPFVRRRSRSRPTHRPVLAEALERRRLLAAEYFAYSLGGLGGPEGWNGPSATDVNLHGQVVGSADTPTLVGGGWFAEHAFVWDRGTMTDLGTLSGPAGESYGSAINDAGQVTGFSISPTGGQTVFLVTPEDTDADGRADRWYRDADSNGVNDLMRPVVNGQAFDINNAGQIVGFSSDEDNGFPIPFVWHNGVLTSLGVLHPGGYGYAYGINESGTVVGLASGSDGATHAFRWTRAGGIRDLGPGTAHDINESGVAVGQVGHSSDGTTTTAVKWSPGSTTPTPLLPAGVTGAAYGINDAGDVVGSDSVGSFLLSGGVVRDLNALMPAGVKWEPRGPTAINNGGQITGGFLQPSWGGSGAYLLSPSDLNLPAVSVADATIRRNANGTFSAVFDVTLSAPSSEPVSVRFTTRDNTALAGTDYVATTGTATIAAGATATQVVVPLLGGDALAGDAKYFSLTIYQSTNTAFDRTRASAATGLFTAPAMYPAGEAYDADAGDFDGDVDVDLVALDRAGRRVTVLLNDGGAGFERRVDTPLGQTQPENLVAGDLNEDGKLDLAVTTFTRTVIGYEPDYYGNQVPVYQTDFRLRVLIGNGDGSFSEPVPARDRGGLSFLNEAADFDNDGDLDLLLGRNDTVEVLLGNGDGTFAAAPRVSNVPVRGEVVDLDSDGTLDIVGATQTSVVAFRGNGDGTFAAGRTLATVAAPAHVNGVAVGDVNGDGRMDVAFGALHPVYDPYYGYFSHYDSSVHVLLGNGDGTFPAPSAANAFPNEINAVGPRLIADVTGDGDADVVTGAIGVLRGNGAGALGEAETVQMAPVFKLVARDLNGDGLTDLAGTNGSHLFVLLQRGDAGPPPPPLPAASVGDVTVAEGDAGSTAAVFTVSLSAASAVPVTVQYSTAGGTAVSGQDFDAAAGTVTFAPGQTTAQVVVAVRGDAVDEFDETFTLRLSGAANATISDALATSTVMDNDAPPAIRISDVTRAEGRGGSTSFGFVVSLSSPSEKEVSVTFATADGTATRRARDYLARSGTLVFLPGETRKLATVYVLGDARRESDETFFLNLSGAANALIEDGQAVGTILDDDTPALRRSRLG